MPENLGDKVLKILKQLDREDGKADGRINIDDDEDMGAKANYAAGIVSKDSYKQTGDAKLYEYISEYLEDRGDIVKLSGDDAIKAAFKDLAFDPKADFDEKPQVTINKALDAVLAKSR